MSNLGPYKVHPFAEKFPLIEGEEFDKLVEDIKQHGLRSPIILTHDRTTLVEGRNRFLACEAALCDPVYETLGDHYTELMIVDYIMSANLHRRHLTTGQRSFVGLEYEKIESIEAEKRKLAGVKLDKEELDLGENSPQGGNIDDEYEVLKMDSTLANSEIKEETQELEEANKANSQEKKSTSTTKSSAQDNKSSAKAGKAVGVSDFAIKQAKAIESDAPDLAARVISGEMSLNAAYEERKRRLAEAQRKREEEAVRKAREEQKKKQVILQLRTHDGSTIPYPKPQAKAKFNETQGEGISWANWSWNPVTGCLHGCNYCYAREIATNPRTNAAFPVGFTPLFHEERLDAPANTPFPRDASTKPYLRRVFVCSMADLYGRWVPDEWVSRVHESCAANPQWDYLLLTKFPSRYVGLDLPKTSWAGTSVDEQKRVRIAEDAFRQIEGVAVKWLSLEPLNEPLEFTDLSMFDWVVIGAQTETFQPDGIVRSFAPPFEWVSKIVAQAREAGCRIHLKPNLLGSVSGRSPGMQLPNEYPDPPYTHE